MGFEPIVTGATFQRVSRFATATPIGALARILHEGNEAQGKYGKLG